MKKIIKLLPIVLMVIQTALIHAQNGSVNEFCDLGADHANTSGLRSSNYQQGLIPQCTVAVYYTGTTILAPIYSSITGTATVTSFYIANGGDYDICPTGVSMTGGGGVGAAASVSCTDRQVTAVTVTNPGFGYTTPPTVTLTGGVGIDASVSAILSGNLTNPFTARTDAFYLFYSLANQGIDIVMSGGIPPNTYPTPRTLTDIFPSAPFSAVAIPIFEVNGVPLISTSIINFRNSTNVTITNPTSGNIDIAAAGGGSSSCGSVVGDITSTDCGANNRQTDTATIPANDSTFGYTNLNINTTTETTAVGINNGINTIGQKSILMGDINAQGVAGVNKCNLIYSNVMGFSNVSQEASTATTGVCAGTTLNQVTILGNNNLNYLPGSGILYFQDVILGSYNLNTAMTGTLYTGQELDNSQIIGNTAARGIAGSSITAIGDSAMDNHANTVQINNVFSIVAIGQAAGSGIADGESSGVFIGVGAGGGTPDFGQGMFGGGGDEQTCVGHNACTQSNGTNTIAIGLAAMGGIGLIPRTYLAHNSGANNIALGYQAGRAQTTGSTNIYIGLNAGCFGCDANSLLGDGNQTGSNQIDIGQDSGPSTTSQLSNIITIGNGARTAISNSTVIGNSAITQATIYGIQLPGTIYSAAGTALPSCSGGLTGGRAVVSDGTSPTFRGTYTSGGSNVVPVICDGTNWLYY